MIDQSCSVASFSESQAHVVAAPNTRGTLTILWSSIFTLLACTWTIQHLNVPRQHETDGLKQKLAEQWRKLKWMIVAMIVPEYILGRAAAEYWSAHNTYRDMLREIPEMRKSWTLVHAFYTNMGGFVLRNMVPVSEGARSRPSIELLERPRTAGILGESVDVETVGQIGPQNSLHKPALEATTGPLLSSPTIEWVPFAAVNGAQLRELLEMGAIEKMPSISKAEIQDKSKGDVFVKMSAVVQILWLCIQLIVRKVEGLPTSQLEIAVLAFSVCTIVTYIFWMDKPKDIRTPTYVDVARPITAIEADRITSEDLLDSYSLFEALLLGRYPQFKATVPNDASFLNAEIGVVFGNYPLHADEFGFVLGGLLFGAIHFLAWNFHFPSPIERTLWRIASFAMTLLLPFWDVLMVLLRLGPGSPVQKLLSWTTAVIYTTARLFIMVEIFRSLLYLPTGAYVTTSWPSSLPHFG